MAPIARILGARGRIRPDIVTGTILIVLLTVVVAGSLLGYRSAAVRAERARGLVALKDKPAVIADFSTPEGAILMLEEAFRRMARFVRGS